MFPQVTTGPGEVIFAVFVAAAVAWACRWGFRNKEKTLADAAAYLYTAPARLALLRPPRALYPWVRPRGVMNLRSLPEDCGGMLFDVDANYLVQLELKQVQCCEQRTEPNTWSNSGVHVARGA
jgi:hypothetical protein